MILDFLETVAGVTVPNAPSLELMKVNAPNWSTAVVSSGTLTKVSEHLSSK